jgi:hypothetical protein
VSIKSPKKDHYVWRKDTTTTPFLLGNLGSDTPQTPTVTVGSEITFRWIIDVPLTAPLASANFAAAYPSSGFALSGQNYLDLLTWRGPLTPDNTGRTLLLFTEFMMGWGGLYVGDDNLDAASLELKVWTFPTARTSRLGPHFAATSVVSATDHMKALDPDSTLRDCVLDGTVDTKLCIQITNTTGGGGDIQAGKMILIAKAIEL